LIISPLEPAHDFQTVLRLATIAATIAKAEEALKTLAHMLPLWHGGIAVGTGLEREQKGE